MADPVGAAVGIASLVGLYITCLELVEAGKSFAVDSHAILTRFEAEKLLLKRWGENVGITAGCIQPCHHAKLDTAEERTMIYNILASIETIFTDADALSSRYGLQLASSPSSLTSQTRDVQDMANNNPRRVQNETLFKRKASWAIRDKKKFSRLVADLGAFIEQLYSLVMPERTTNNSASTAELRDMLDVLKSSIDGNSWSHWVVRFGLTLTQTKLERRPGSWSKQSITSEK